MADNSHIDVASSGFEDFRTVFGLFRPPGGKIIGYREDTEKKRLILYWTETGGITRLLYPMTTDQAAKFAYGWLDHTDYGKEPDHDGDNDRGWRVYNESWNMVGNEFESVLAVQPYWMMYGK